MKTEFRTLNVPKDAKDKFKKLAIECEISESQLFVAVVTFLASNNITVERAESTIRIEGEVKRP